MITQEMIEAIIIEEVRMDIYEDLYNVDRAADAIMLLIEAELKALQDKLTEQSWAINSDRSGGQFTDEEIARARDNNW